MLSLSLPGLVGQSDVRVSSHRVDGADERLVGLISAHSRVGLSLESELASSAELLSSGPSP